MRSLFIQYFLILLLCESIKSQDYFSYSNGERWKELSPICETGQRQSPIDINLYTLKELTTCPALKLVNHDEKPKYLTIENSGHGVLIKGKWQNSRRPRVISYISSNTEYEFVQWHLHWGTTNINGTEHRLNSQGYSAESHLLYKNVKYETYEKARDNEDGLLVLAYFYSTSKRESYEMKYISDSLLKITEPKDIAYLEPPKPLFKFGVSCKNSFINYFGSLTTPPCSESVQWNICLDNHSISPDTLQKVRNMHLNDNDKTNVRPLQNVNTRTVYHVPCGF